MIVRFSHTCGPFSWLLFTDEFKFRDISTRMSSKAIKLSALRPDSFSKPAFDPFRTCQCIWITVLPEKAKSSWAWSEWHFPARKENLWFYELLKVIHSMSVWPQDIMRYTPSRKFFLGFFSPQNIWENSTFLSNMRWVLLFSLSPQIFMRIIFFVQSQDLRLELNQVKPTFFSFLSSLACFMTSWMSLRCF